MSLASSNRTGILRIKEATWGVTPTTPALIDTRYTGEGINSDLENITSEEIRSDRQTTDLVQVSQSSNGNLDIELSYAAYDDFIESALHNEWTSTLVTSTATADEGIVFATAGTITIGSALAHTFVVDQWIRVAGATNANNNLFYRITGITGNALTVSPVPGTNETNTTGATLRGKVIRNSVDQTSFTIEKVLNDATVPTYHIFRGMIVDGMSLNFETGAILGGSFSFLGKGSEMTETQISGATVVAAAANQVMNSVSNIDNVLVNDSPTSFFIQSLTMDLANNLREQRAIGSIDAVGIASGRLEITGNISVYFETKAEYDRYVAADYFKLSYRVQDGDGNAYIFTFPRIKYESMTLNSSGLDTDVVLEGTWRGIRAPSSNCMLQIDAFTA
jgi:hypothetical protein